jgi:hypothetical protein
MNSRVIHQRPSEDSSDLFASIMMTKNKPPNQAKRTYQQMEEPEEEEEEEEEETAKSPEAYVPANTYIHTHIDHEVQLPEDNHEVLENVHSDDINRFCFACDMPMLSEKYKKFKDTLDLMRKLLNETRATHSSQRMWLAVQKIYNDEVRKLVAIFTKTDKEWTIKSIETHFTSHERNALQKALYAKFLHSTSEIMIKDYTEKIKSSTDKNIYTEERVKVFERLMSINATIRKAYPIV